jgi:cytochrome c
MNSSYFNSAAGAFLGLLFILMTLSIVSDGIYHAAEPETEGFMIEVAEGGGDAAEPAEEAAPELIEPLLASADPAKGENVFKKCAACHTNDASNANKVGPGLWNIVNRPVATHADFNYSGALTEYSEGGSVEWTYERLSNFLAAPKKYIPGTSMGFAGLKKIEERADLIAYLRTVADTPPPLPGE